MNDLQLYFESNNRRLMHKWMHYFDIYDRHFSRYRGTDVHIVEIGIYHGGSLQMWREYFGPSAKIIGIDIDPRCKELEEEGIEIIIGNQEDREFLRSLKQRIPRMDILLDDGGHTMQQQIVTFEELFSHVAEDGVYLCEDLHTSYWGGYGGGFRKPSSFIEYSKDLIDFLNAWHSRDPESFPVNQFTRSAYSMNFYGSVLVIEKQPMSPPCDRMIGQPSFDFEEMAEIKQQIEAGQTLFYERHVEFEDEQGRYAELNARFFKLLDDYQSANIHAGNLQGLLQDTQRRLEESHQQVEQLYQQLQESQHQTHEQLLQNQQLHQQLGEAQQLHQQFQTEVQQLQEKLRISLNQATALKSLNQDQAEEIHQLHQRIQESQDKQEQHIQRRLRQIEAELKHRDLELQFAVAERDQYRGRLTAIESSKFWQLRTQWLLVKSQMGGKESPFWTPDLPFPQPTRADLPQLEQAVKPVAKPIAVPVESDYDRWRRLNEPRPADYQRMRETLKMLTFQPLISIIVPTYNTPEAFLREAIDSVINQIYPHWELCIADDASSDPHVREILEEYSAKDRRIKVVFRSENGHISRSSNSAIELATGEYIALLDHDDVLRPEALYEVVFLLNQHPEADMIYSDEDKIDETGQRRDPFFKPGWCPDSFLGRMYTCHLGIYRRSIIEEIGGFRVGYEGSQDYDLVLRFTEKTDRIFHIPKVLYSWRIHQQSSASGSDAKPYAYTAAKKAIADALRRRGEPGVIHDVLSYLGHYSVRYYLANQERVSIIIPTRDLGDDLDRCLKSVFSQSTYPSYEVILIDNGSVETRTAEIIDAWAKREPERFSCYELDIPFNYSKLNNFGVSKATGKYLLFLNNDTQVITYDWIEAMVEQAQRPSIGAVGALLLYEDNTIQHAGVVMGLGALAGHAFNRVPASSPGHFGQLLTPHNYSAVTGACMMCRREVFEAVGGFNEDLTIALNDVDLCLRMLEQGYRNILLPHAMLYHYESKSRGFEDSDEKQARFAKECEYMKQRWKEIYENDPCYSPNLSRRHADYRIREAQE